MFSEHVPNFGTGQRFLFLVLTKKIKVSEDRQECSIIHAELTVEQTTEKKQQKNISVVASTKPKGTSRKLLIQLPDYNET